MIQENSGVSRVVVFGAAGRTGRLVVEEAARAGYDVAAAVRAPERCPSFDVRQGEVDVVRADMREPDSVLAAVKGQDVVISAVGHAGARSHGLYADAARALVTAMRHGGVTRVIAVTSAGVRHDDPNFALWYRLLARTLAKEPYDDMRLMEAVIREAGLDWTFVRPARLLDEPPTGAYRVQDGETPKGGWKITRADLARFIVQELHDPHWSHAAPTLAE
ncbi:NAD(P)-dependent oxidoreductase [Sphaerisporangium fuscum]|uniref:NAD(P)-dependent oxidoreductase n=1 Tax=Sphaerisporangium fuscum TaxID=2835868 RepID=UPI001BDD362B|nr:SDR family oxidoreductase [Sphaerisporangium fuscum]